MRNILPVYSLYIHALLSVRVIIYVNWTVIDNAIRVVISFSAYGLVVLIWISFSLYIYILVNTCEDVPPINNTSVFLPCQLPIIWSYTWMFYRPIVDSILSRYLWCHAVYISLYLWLTGIMPTGSRLLRIRADEHRSVELSWVESRRVGMHSAYKAASNEYWQHAANISAHCTFGLCL